MYRQSTVFLFALALLAGCASQPIGRSDLIGFLQEGQTSRETVFLRLGEPSAVYEEGGILTYRLGKDKGGYYLLQKVPGFYSVNYSLVLVFDENGRLARHSLVQVRSP